MNKVKPLKWIAYLFLALVSLIVLLLGLVFSPLGVSTLVSIANDQKGLVIESHSGSFYSQVQLNNVEFNNQQIAFSTDALTLDLSVNCLFTGEICLQKLALEHASLTLESTSETQAPSESLNEYISLPLNVKVDEISVAMFTLYQAQAEQAQAHKLLQIENLFTRFSMHKRLDIAQIKIASIDYYQAQNTQSANKTLAQDEPAQAISLAERLAQLYDYEYSPIALPQVFIPLNLSLQKLAIDKICIHQADTFCTQSTEAKLTIAKQNVKASLSTSPQQFAVAKVQTSIQVNLAKQFEHKVSLNLSPNKELSSAAAGSININLLGNIKKTQLGLNTQTASGSQKIIEATVALDPQLPRLPLDVSIEGRDIAMLMGAWLPDVDMPLNSLVLNLKGDTAQYEISAKAALKSQQLQALGSDIDLAAQVSIQDKNLVLERLESSGEIGRLLANAKINLKPLQDSSAALAHVLDFDSKLNFTNLQLGTLLPDLQSNLTGELASTGRFEAKQTAPSDNTSLKNNNTLAGSLVCKDIRGRVLDYQLSLICDAVIDKDGLVEVKRFELNQGSEQAKQNKISGKGTIDLPSGLNENAINSDFSQTRSDFALALDLQDLSYLYPSLSGVIAGDLSVSGSVDKPKIIADLTIEQVEYAQLQISTAAFDASINAAENWATDLQLSTQNMRVNGQELESVLVSLVGDINAHELNLRLSHPSVSLKHKLSGSLKLNSQDPALSANKAWEWQGQWQSGEWQLAFDTLRLDKPIDIAASPTSASLSSHCWLSAQAAGTTSKENSSESAQTMRDAKGNKQAEALCFSNVVYAEEEVSSNASIDYDLARAARFYLSDIVGAGTYVPLQSDINFAYKPKEGLSASAYNLITGGKLVTSRHNIDLMAVVANVELADETVFTSVYAGTDGFGSLGLRSELSLTPDNRTHQGQISINQLKLSPLLRFLPKVERIAGGLDGSLGFAGPLDKPMLNGQIELADGELVVDNYPYPLSNFNQVITVNDNLAEVEGEFELGAGTGEYQADINFAEQLSVVGTLKGAGMQIAYANNELLATPNLAFDIRPDNIKLSGSIAIPNAQFKLDELPESAKSPTSDTIIIGEPAPEPIIPTGLNIDLRILVDEPKLKRVNIDALDLKASLAGDLRLRVIQEKNSETGNISPMQTYVNGTVNILQGRYAAYGQVLEVRTGNIYFTGPPSLPQFDISAIRDPLNTADQVVAGIRVSGNPVVPKVEIFSEPAMIQARQLSYLLQGTDLGSSNNTSNDVLLLNMLVAYGVGGSENRVNKLGKSLGFDTLNIRTAGQGNDTQVQVTGRIAENIQVTYGVGLFDSVSEVILKYQLLPKLYIEVKSGAVSAVDLFYELSRGE